MSQIGELQIRLRAIDEASDVVSEASRNISGSLSEVERVNEAVRKAQDAAKASARDLLTGFSGLASSAFSLYQGLDRIEKAQYAVEKANYSVQAAVKAVEDAQRRYNEAVAKYGEGSEEALKASRDLELAQERYRLALEKADIAQGNLNQTIAQVALSVVPTVITAVDSGVKAFKSFQAALDALNGVTAFLAANPLMAAVMAIGLVTAALITAYQTCEPFRNAVNSLGEALGAFLRPAIEALVGAWKAFCEALGWGYDTFIKPVIDGLKWLADTLGGAADAASKALGGFKDAVSNAFSNAGKAIEDFIGSICFAHAIEEAVDSAEKDLRRFVDVVNKSMEGASEAIADLRGVGPGDGFGFGALGPSGGAGGAGAGAVQGPVTINLTLNATVSGEADEERLARRVAEAIAFSLYRRHRSL